MSFFGSNYFSANHFAPNYFDTQTIAYTLIVPLDPSAAISVEPKIVLPHVPRCVGSGEPGVCGREFLGASLG